MRLNGLDFHVEVEGSGPPLLVLHGFTGSVRSWDGLRAALANQARVVAIDLIGHGHSAAPADAARYSFDWSVRDLLALLDELHLESIDVLGYSLGGRLALHLALHATGRVRRLILESASAGIQDDAERARRIASDAVLAERIEREGIAAFVNEWEAQPLLGLAPHVSQAVREAQHAQRLANRPVGLANSLRGMGAGQQASLWTSLPAVLGPVQLIVGQLDSRYCELGARLRAGLPSAELAIVADAGHTVHLDQPDRFYRLVEGFLAPN
jgi:2-succinyl-6-hydroxy-2,4-cyclohexadiene-1-carboxylate synthase